jgi:simple sugar transport system ATP-binding protein
LEIVRLLACGARLLILDEPTTGISASQARALFAALRTLVAEGNTVLFVSHKLEEVAALCDTVSVLRAGRLVAAELPMPQPQAELLAMMFGREQEPRTENPEPSGSDHRAQRTIANPVAAQQAAQERAQRTVPIWELRDVTLREGAFQLSGLSYRIAPGSVVGLAGLEGSGQQLLLRALSGRLPPIRGTIELDGVDMTRARAAAYRRAGVEYLPADRLRDGMIGSLSLADHFTLEDRDPARLLNRERADQRAQRAITDYAIKALPSSPIAALSGGNQQRAMLALLPDRCRGILCEQPTRGLDIASAHAIWQRLLGRRSDGTAIIFASADLDELLAYSDHVLVFFGGKVSLLLPRSELDATRLAELIGGVGFVY